MPIPQLPARSVGTNVVLPMGSLVQRGGRQRALCGVQPTAPACGAARPRHPTRPGPGPLSSDLPWAAGLHITGEARSVIDNLAPSFSRAGQQARTLSVEELGDWLVRKAQVRPDGWLAGLKAQVLAVADELGVPEQKARGERLLDEVAGTRPPLRPPGRLMAARLRGKEFDIARLQRFEELAKYLAAIPSDLEVPAPLVPSMGENDGTLPFFEAYFSNFIEGTEFSIEEAEAIVASGTAPANRPADAHDILGTFRVVSDPVGRQRSPRRLRTCCSCS